MKQTLLSIYNFGIAINHYTQSWAFLDSHGLLTMSRVVKGQAVDLSNRKIFWSALTVIKHKIELNPYRPMWEQGDGNGSGSRQTWFQISYRKIKNLKSLGMVILKPEPEPMQDCQTSKFVFINLRIFTSG